MQNSGEACLAQFPGEVNYPLAFIKSRTRSSPGSFPLTSEKSRYPL